MGRRLITIVGIALAAACGVRLVPAQQADLASPPAQGPRADSSPAGDAGPPPSASDPDLAATPPGGLEGAGREPAQPPVDPLPAPSPLPPADDAAPLLPGQPAADRGAMGAPDPGIAPTAGPAEAGPAQASDPTGAAGADKRFMLDPGDLGLGRQVVGLSVDVQAPERINLFQETKLKIVVKNTGTSRAMGVVVRDPLPEGLEYRSSQPEAKVSGQLLTWRLDTLAANSERVLVVSVRPVKPGSFDHAPTVEILAGGKSRTLVQEPKLKVEQTVKGTKESVLKGTQVEFDIAVSNPGSGPVRNVLVRARLSSGLRHEQGDYVEQVVAEIKPGERKLLESLVVEATAGGEQTCAVGVSSPDVPQDTEEATATQKIDVIEPKLQVKLVGPARRYTDTTATYRVIVENPGSAATRNVKVGAIVPVGGVFDPEGTDRAHDFQYDRYKRRLYWTINQLDPGGHVELRFTVRLAGLQLFQVAAEATSNSPIALSDRTTFNTDVTGMADVDFEVSERRRIVDVGEETAYEIVIKNRGTKDAARLLVYAMISDHFEVLGTGGTDKDALGDKNQRGKMVFPAIDRLAPKGELRLTIFVRAVKPGIGSCQVSLMHDDLKDTMIANSTTTRVEPSTSQAR